jgi:hypothetical protein
VSTAVAEITPVQVNPREITRFNYMVLPQFAAADQVSTASKS